MQLIDSTYPFDLQSKLNSSGGALHPRNIQPWSFPTTPKTETSDAHNLTPISRADYIVEGKTASPCNRYAIALRRQPVRQS